MDKNKSKKYLKYVFLEIFLVMAGILLALQVNNWNENRGFLKKANSYISDVKKDLKVDTSYFNNVIKRIEIKIGYKKSLYNQDSLVKLSTGNIQNILTTGTNNISINNGAYKKIVESGILTLSEKKFLFEKFNNYYSGFNNYLNEFNEWEDYSVKKDMDFWIYQNHYEIEYFDSIYPKHNLKENRKALLKIINSVEGKNYINMAISREQTMKGIYTKARNGAEKLIRIIDSVQS